MPKQAKSISVHLVLHDTLSLFPVYSVCMGAISAKQYDQIKAEFFASDCNQSTCMRNLNINYYENIIFGIIKKTTNLKQLAISGLTWMDPDRTPQCQNCTDKTTRKKMNICAQNMRNGKCCDPLLRRTFGAALFPQFYAKNNQK